VFGNLINQTGSTPNNYLFAGEQYDPALAFTARPYREVQLVRIAEGILLERQAMRAGPFQVQLRLVPCLRLITKSCVTSKRAVHR